MQFDEWYLQSRVLLLAFASLWFIPKKWRVFVAQMVEAFDKKSFDWYILNRQKLAALARLWFLPKKWKDLLLTILNTFDLFLTPNTKSLSVDFEDDRPPVIPIIIIGPDGNPIPLPPSKPKPPTP